MSNVNLQASASTTTYNISLEQMEELIAENLMVPVECISVRYKISVDDDPDPNFSSTPPCLTEIEVTVNNVLYDEIDRGCAGLTRTR